MQNTIVVKFGGSSLATAAQIEKAAAILKADPARRYAVVSAPGKRTDADGKVTDLLYRCCELASAKKDFSAPLLEIEGRFREIAAGLNVKIDLDAEFARIREHLETAPDRDYVSSRGEYLNGRLIATRLGWDFIDPAEAIRFDADGALDAERTYRVLGDRLAAAERAVIPGFYGVLPDGRVHTFSRGGSDITGSIVARAAQARVYENWTDVSGLLTADPRVVREPRVIDYITYTELRELAYMGASVLHEEAIFPVRQAGIPINIRNTNRPADPGTMIVPEFRGGIRRRTVTGIAGRKGFTGVVVEKSLMNGEIGFGARLLQIFADHGVPFEHCPTGIDAMSVVVGTAEFNARKEEILEDIRRTLEPEILSVNDGLALIAVVGQGMAYTRDIAARLFAALARAGVALRLIDMGSGGLNIIVGVDETDYAAAIRALYEEVEALM